MRHPEQDLPHHQEAGLQRVSHVLLCYCLQSEDAEVSSAPQLKGAWGSGSIASRLAQAQKGEALKDCL